MRAAVVTDGGVEVREVAKPTPGPEQVLVRVRAAGLNRADLQVASGRSHGAMGGAGTIVGLEFAGEVEAVGSAVKAVKPGDRVMASGNGGYAEYAVADWGRVSPVPANNMSWEHYSEFLWDEFTPRWSPNVIVVAPDGFGQVLWRWMGEADVLGVIDDVSRHYNVDADRVILAGLSNGGLGAYAIGTGRAANR